eukprot:PITA_28523
MERARNMLNGAGLGQEFWAEVVDTACYLVNRSPSSTWRIRLHKKYGLSDVVFREVKDVIKHEVQPKEPVKIEFELKEEESDSVAVEESEDEEPQTPANCEGSSGFRGWKTLEEAMVDEMASLHKNEAWDLVELPAGRKPIGSKWVFKKKTNAEGKVEKYKARLVAKGYSQVPGIDFDDFLLLPR